MKLRYLLLGVAIISTNSLANTSIVTFEGLNNAYTFIQDGFRFDGVLSLDSNFPSSPALRIYGNTPLTISSIDGNTFSLNSFNLLYRYDASTPWWISNDRGQGFQLSRAGEFLPFQFPTSTLQDVSRLTIFDPLWIGTNYYSFDNFQFSYAVSASPIPEPTSTMLVLASLGLLSISRYRTITKMP